MPTPAISPSSTVFADLHEAYKRGELLVFAGAGISAAAGLPSWPELAKRLRDRIAAEGASADVLTEVDRLIQRQSLIDALSAIRRHLGDLDFFIAVEKAVDDAPVAVPDVAQAIADLAPKLRGVLTTNLDRFLERAFAGAWAEVTTVPGDLTRRQQYIWKVHGTRIDRRTWVFTRDQYDRVTFGQPEHRAVFEALFRSFPILFVGYGLEDDDLDQTLGSIRTLSGPNPPTHYALLQGPVGSYRRSELQRSGIRLLEYANHADVPAILRAISKGVLPTTAPAPTVSTMATP